MEFGLRRLGLGPDLGILGLRHQNPGPNHKEPELIEDLGMVT